MNCRYIINIVTNTLWILKYPNIFTKRISNALNLGSRNHCNQFKLCTLMFHINRGTAPQYLSDTRLRSNVSGNFVISRTRLHVLVQQSLFHRRVSE